MYISNITVFMPSVLTLIGIPGLESVQCWIGIPFCIMYLIAMIGNSLLLIIIKSEPSLHEPMYIFLGMLGVVSIGAWIYLWDFYLDMLLKRLQRVVL